MDDKYFFGAFIYLFIVFTSAAFLPSGLWTGTYSYLEDSGNYTASLYGDINETAPPDGFFQRTTFIYKLATLLFTPFILPIPGVISAFLALFNYLCMIVGGVWIYDKLRGIGG